jgi:hypothetical protein
MSNLLLKLIGLNRLQGALFTCTSMDILINADESLVNLTPALTNALRNFKRARDTLFVTLKDEILLGCKLIKEENDVFTADTGESIQEQLNNLTFGKFT